MSVVYIHNGMINALLVIEIEHGIPYLRSFCRVESV